MTCRWVGEMSKYSLRRSQGKVFHNSHNLSTWRATEDSNFKQLIMRCKLKRRHTQKTYQDVSFKVDVFVSLFAFAALSFKSLVVSHLGVVFLPIVSFVQDLKTMISNHVMLVKVNFWYILITFFCKRKKIQFSFLPEGTGLTCVSRTNFDLLAGIWKISARVDLSRWDLSSLILEYGKMSSLVTEIDLLWEYKPHAFIYEHIKTDFYKGHSGWRDIAGKPTAQPSQRVWPDSDK